jgi:DNA-directed RNA polymerase subunit RPC12/RpoP
MDTILLLMLPFLAALAFVLFHTLRRVRCPDCGDPLPVLYSPFKKTRRMWRAGGYLCARCGCETDMAGQKVTADTPPAPFPTFQWAVLAVSLLVGVALAATLTFGGLAAVAAPPMVAAPQVIAAPPAVVPPLQAPALAPVN